MLTIQTYKIAEELKRKYTQMPAIGNFETYSVVDGGNVNQLWICIGVANNSSAQALENLSQDIAVVETTLKIKTITSVTVETLVFLPEMSL